MEAELKGTAKAEAAQRRRKEYMDRVVDRQAKRTRSMTPEGENQQKTQKETTGQADEGMLAQGSGRSSSDAMGASKPEDSEKRDRTDKKSKTDEEHPEDPKRSDGMRKRSERGVQAEENRKFLRGSQKWKSSRKIRTGESK